MGVQAGPKWTAAVVKVAGHERWLAMRGGC